MLTILMRKIDNLDTQSNSLHYIPTKSYNDCENCMNENFVIEEVEILLKNIYIKSRFVYKNFIFRLILLFLGNFNNFNIFRIALSFRYF